MFKNNKEFLSFLDNKIKNLKKDIEKDKLSKEKEKILSEINILDLFILNTKNKNKVLRYIKKRNKLIKNLKEVV
jgi:hypothetical protein